jgi:ADP-heptose:LPS heptosyltransferase
MAEPRFLLVRLGSLGDIVHALPAAASLRDTFPEARIDWIVDSKWERLLGGNRYLNNVISLKSKSASGISVAVRRLRSAKYTHAIDFQELAQQIIRAAGNPAPVALPFELGPLKAALRRAKFVVSADTWPLHLASALKTPVVGLFGPTDPARNGPHSPDDVVVRNPQFGETTYRRGASYSPAMLSIAVEQVVEAVQRRLRLRS